LRRINKLEEHSGDRIALTTAERFHHGLHSALAIHYMQIYNAPYVSIRKSIWSAAMAPERLHIAGFKQFSFKTVFKCQKRYQLNGCGHQESSRL